MEKRIELCILTKTTINNFVDLSKKDNIVNVYIKSSLLNLSETRKTLIDLGYTTRLFIVLYNGKKEEYIYGKRKGQKGVFKEHCKNSVFRKSIVDVIDISSEKDNVILLDNEQIKKNYNGENREWMLI